MPNELLQQPLALLLQGSEGLLRLLLFLLEFGETVCYTVRHRRPFLEVSMLLGPVVCLLGSVAVLAGLSLVLTALLLLPGWLTAPLSALVGWRLGVTHGQQQQALGHRTAQMQAGTRTTEV